MAMQGIPKPGLPVIPAATLPISLCAVSIEWMVGLGPGIPGPGHCAWSRPCSGTPPPFLAALIAGVLVNGQVQCVEPGCQLLRTHAPAAWAPVVRHVHACLQVGSMQHGGQGLPTTRAFRLDTLVLRRRDRERERWGAAWARRPQLPRCRVRRARRRRRPAPRVPSHQALTSARAHFRRRYPPLVGTDPPAFLAEGTETVTLVFESAIAAVGMRRGSGAPALSAPGRQEPGFSWSLAGFLQELRMR